MSVTQTGIARQATQRLRRSKAAKQVFRDAEHFAEIANSLVFPIHLLYAVTLTENQARDRLLKEFGIELKRLQQVAQREVMLSPPGEPLSLGTN